MRGEVEEGGGVGWDDLDGLGEWESGSVGGGGGGDGGRRWAWWWWSGTVARSEGVALA